MQQTQVVQGYDYYMRFVERFPTVEALAAAEEEEVLNLWQGLGYYSRARNMHYAAQTIVKAGGFPENYRDVLALKGVGEYTAAAICSFAFDLPHAVVDGNVYRVLARYFDICTPIDTSAGKREFGELADLLLDRNHPGNYNQAIMDFGALQCTPQTPDCGACPLNGSCRALEADTVRERPVKAKRTKVSERYFVFVYVRFGSKCYLRRRGVGDIWRGLYEPVLLEFGSQANYEAVRSHPLVKQFLPPTMPHAWRTLKTNVKHQLTHRLIYADFYLLTLDEKCSMNEDVGEYRLLEESDRDKYPVSKLVEKLYEMV